MALESCNLFFSKPAKFAPGETYCGTGTKLPPDEHAGKILMALSFPDGIVCHCPKGLALNKPSK